MSEQGPLHFDYHISLEEIRNVFLDATRIRLHADQEAAKRAKELGLEIGTVEEIRDQNFSIILRYHFKKANLQEMLDDIAIENVKAMCAKLASGFSAKTKRIVIPRGTKQWWVYSFSVDTMSPGKKKAIELIPFFGMMVGYDKEEDILVYWEEK